MISYVLLWYQLISYDILWFLNISYDILWIVINLLTSFHIFSQHPWPPSSPCLTSSCVAQVCPRSCNGLHFDGLSGQDVMTHLPLGGTKHARSIHTDQKISTNINKQIKHNQTKLHDRSINWRGNEMWEYVRNCDKKCWILLHIIPTPYNANICKHKRIS